MSFTFKQFNQYLDAPAQEEQLDEIFGIFASKEQKEKAEKAKLELLAKKGNVSAQMQLRKQRKDDDLRDAAVKHSAASKDAKWKTGQAETEAGERGSSRAYDRETGSAHTTMKPRWNGAKGHWEKYNATAKKWEGTDDTDKYSGVEYARR